MPELAIQPESQALHMEAPLLVQAEPDFGVPFGHLQLFFSHLVLPELMVYPLLHLSHIEAPLLVQAEPDLGVPWSHLQVLPAQFEVQTMTLRMRWLSLSATSAYLPAGSMATRDGDLN